MFNKSIAIDLGTSNTVVYIKPNGIIFNEPTCIAVNESNNHTYAVGYCSRYAVPQPPVRE